MLVWVKARPWFYNYVLFYNTLVRHEVVESREAMDALNTAKNVQDSRELFVGDLDEKLRIGCQNLQQISTYLGDRYKRDPSQISVVKFTMPRGTGSFMNIVQVPHLDQEGNEIPISFWLSRSELLSLSENQIRGVIAGFLTPVEANLEILAKWPCGTFEVRHHDEKLVWP
tara:strand:- start:2572 stop:3081 length:510 start_codon:yes stop_codon:yes gene_type:complete